MGFVFSILRIFVGAVLLYAGVSKLLRLTKTRASLEEFGVSHRFSKPSALALPIAELFIAGAIIWPGTGKAGLAATYLLFTVFTAVIAYNLLIGRTPACSCFGQRSETPISIQTVLRNASLMVVTALALGWGLSLSPIFVLAILGVPLTASLALMIALLRRIFERTKEIDERVSELADYIQSDLASHGARTELTLPGDPLPIGSPAPDFELEAMDGRVRRLQDILETGKTSIFLFMSPDCGPCLAMVPRAEQWQRDFNGRMAMIVISKGDLKKNRKEFGATDLEVLIQRDSEVGTSYRAKWTPAAIAISGEGVIASNVAFGDVEVRSLIEHLSRTGTDSPWVGT